MSLRTQIFQQLPWIGGLNTSLDEALIAPNQLTEASNVVFGVRGSRKKREGINHDFDNLTIASVSRSSSGTTRTVVTSGFSWRVGDSVTISGAGESTYNGTFSVTAVSTTTSANDTIAFTGGSSLTEGSTADVGMAFVLETEVLAGHDFWFGSTTRSQLLVMVDDTGRVWSINDSGTRTDRSEATVWTTPSQASIVTYNNKVFLAVDGSGNKIKYWDGAEATTDDLADDVAGGDQAPPLASVLHTHIGRIWCNDKANPDLLHYCEAGNHLKWSGSGDSGAFPIGEGDGDPVGIKAIWSFKGDLFVAKQTKLYRVRGYSPEDMVVELISNNIGCISHNSVANIEQDDVYWVSEKGVHSLVATANYGDFSQNYVSIDIQESFNEDFARSRLRYTSGAYLPELNSVAFTFTEETVSNFVNTDENVNNVVWLFNIPAKAWYRWPDLGCRSIFVVNNSDKKRFYLGTHHGRLSKTLSTTLYDVSETGSSVAIRFRVSTGRLSLDGNPYTMKALKRFILYYKPAGTHTVTASIRIDNYGLDPENSLSFNEVEGGATLGVSFTLGSSALGYDVVMAPHSRSVDGFGRGVKITIEQSGTNEEVEIQGFGIEYESAGTSPETFL